MERQTEPDLQSILRRLEEAAKGTFWDYLGCKLEEAEPGKIVVSLKAAPWHLNGIGILHGGVHASLLDNAMGIVAMVARPVGKVVTTNLNVHYVAPLYVGKLFVTAELVHQSRKMITVQGSVEDEQGRLGSWGSGSYRVTGVGDPPA